MRPAQGADLARLVIRWQRSHGRHDLPWQGSRDPYRVWLSEVMLQQTQVATVVGYYDRFLARFPDVQSLAAAPLDDVLALWSGLGYYSRARHLHRAAQAVTSEHGGRFPGTAAGLQQLPGIGRSTAAAIAAFCYGERAAILDGNVKRVLARAVGFDGDLAESREADRLWALAESLLPRTSIEAYTQGLMDLGATRCLARRPRCSECPLADACIALATDRVAQLPLRTRKLRRGRRHHLWMWLARPGQVWLVQRPDSGVWARLWSLPELEPDAVLEQVLPGLPGTPERLPSIAHTLTHFDWRLDPLLWQLPARGAALDRRLARHWPDGRWFALEDALAAGIPAPLRALLQSRAQAS